jgi:pimeloyl-ACP methyl ester carboxylesterase
MWEPQLADLAKDFRLIAPDYPGLGESPVSPAPYSLELLADSIMGRLQSMGVSEKVALLGLSMGGYLAYEVVRNFPERLNGLILAATHPAPDSEPGRQAREETAALARTEGLEPLADRMLPRLLGNTTRMTQPDLMGKIRGLILTNEKEGVAQASLAMATRRDSVPLLPRIQIPTLLLSGTEDAIVPGVPPDAVQRQIPGSSWKVIEQSGHLLNLEQPVEFNRCIREFMSWI